MFGGNANANDMITPQIKLVYKTERSTEPAVKIDSAYKAAKLFLPLFDDELIEYREEYWAMFLNRAGELIGVMQINIGTTIACIIDVKATVTAALLCGAARVITCHNHPSGNLVFSKGDEVVFGKLRESCELLDIILDDNLIISPAGFRSESNGSVTFFSELI